MTRVFLKKGRAKPIWFGHPWVYSEAIDRVDGPMEPGDEVTVVDESGRFIGRGLANPRSQIRVRVASRRDEPLDETWIAGRLRDAQALRRRLGLPSEHTNAYRLVNSEGDFLPGLIVDVYGDALSVQFTTLAMKRREASIYAALGEVSGAKLIFEAAAGGFAQVEGFASEGRQVLGAKAELVPCCENGIRLEVEPLSGQKTGGFLDQRANRTLVGHLAAGARVLDLYGYAGGFGLAAAAGGAASVSEVDISARALERARAHFELNHLGAPEVIESDAFRYLERASAGAFDLVVCDPPKFARSRKDLEAALKGYRRLNALAMHALGEGALLCTASCSQLVSEADFQRVLAGAAQDAHKRLQLLHVGSQALDHVVPIGFPEGRYLKFFVCRVLN